jgi:CRP-like cAMP-binding protein
MPIAADHHPKQNHLLAALPRDAFERFAPYLELVPMPLGEVLYESGGQLHHVYFPTTSIVSLLHVMQNGASAEIAVVGNEGLLGVALFMGGETTTSRAVVQSKGHGYRLEGQLLKDEFNRAGPVCCGCCCVIRRRCSPRCRRPRCAIATIPCSSSYAAGCS